jgi:hypothetical protein
MSKAQKVESFTDLEIAPVLRKQRLFEAGQMKLLALHLISFALNMAMTSLKRWVKLWEGAIAQVQERSIQP